LRGLKSILSFAANSNTLVVEFPNIGISTSFTGLTRDDSFQLFKDFLKSNGSGGQRLFKAYARFSPIDPIAGNPNSLMAQMAQASYLLGRLYPLSGCDCSCESQPLVHLFQTGLQVGRAFSGGFDTTIVSLPLRYSYSPCHTWALIIDAPVYFHKNGGAYSLLSSLGIGFRYPITCHWSLTPILRYGVGGSVDLATAGSFFSPGLTSCYDLPIGSFVFSLINSVNYIASTPLHLGGINYDYHLYNYVFKNGFVLTSCKDYCFCGRPLNFSLNFVDSAFTGGGLFINHYDEVGFSLIASGINPCLDYDNLSVGFSYQFGNKNYKGYFVNVIYQF
jgi:hypothetical protein